MEQAWTASMRTLADLEFAISLIVQTYIIIHCVEVFKEKMMELEYAKEVPEKGNQ